MKSVSSGGANLFGTIYRLTLSGDETILHNFVVSDGVNPSGLLRDAKRNLYGTAQAGGTANFGTVFKLTP